jgi:uncharacterized protein with beta-barrel porin domain
MSVKPASTHLANATAVAPLLKPNPLYLASVSTLAVAAVFLGLPQQARAANECTAGAPPAPGAVVNCPGGPYPTGIEYTNVTGLTLNLNDPTIVAQRLNAGSSGAVVGVSSSAVNTGNIVVNALNFGSVTGTGTTGRGIMAVNNGTGGDAVVRMDAGLINVTATSSRGLSASIANAANTGTARVLLNGGTVQRSGSNGTALVAQTTGSGNAEVVVSGGVVTASGSFSTLASATSTTGTASVVIAGGSLTATGGSSGANAFSNGVGSEARVTMTGGTFTTSGTGGLGATGRGGTAAAGNVARVTLSGGDVTALGAATRALYVDTVFGLSTVEMSGGTVSALGSNSDGILAVTSGGTMNVSVSGGLVRGGSGTGAAIATNNSLSGLSSTIVIGAGAVIDGSASGIAIRDGATPLSAINTAITTAGLITGDILLRAGTDSVTVTGGTINGNITGDGVDSVNFAAGQGSFTYAAPYTISGMNTVAINSGTVQVNGTLNTNTLTVNGGVFSLNGATTATNAAVINAGNTWINGTLNTGALAVNGGALVLNGTANVTGAATVNGGLLAVNGSLAASSGTTINTGGTLGGIGTLGSSVTINGGALSPGNSIGTLAVQGNLALTSAASYLVEIDPTTSDRTNVSGTATLGGATVSAIYAGGSYISRRYTILNAAGGVSGTFNSLVNTNLPSNFTAALAYDPNNAYLDLTLNFTPTPGPTPPGPTPPPPAPRFAPLTTNQTNVANALINSFNTAGGIPLVFGTLNAQGLAAVSGEHATGTPQTTFDAMDKFVNILTDPFMGTRAGSAPSIGAGGYADEDETLAYAAKRKRTGAEREAYAAFKAPPKAAALERHWSVWGAGYGGTQQTDGDGAVGSQKFTNHVYGGAAGFDYRLTPETMLGFALGGAGTNFGLTNGLGGGRSEVFQAGLYGRHTSGPAYVSGALAWGWQDITLNRTVFANRYRANFDANALTGRLEGGWRFAYGTSGITPYAAGQVTGFFMPGYAENLVAGVNTFALTYSGKDVTTSRTELGLRGDTSFAAADAIVTLRGRAAWAHNFNTDRSISAIFQTLPASGFTVFGASPARNSALVSAGAEAKWLNGFSVAATFEGEFSGRTKSYAGKGILRYQW